MSDSSDRYNDYAKSHGAKKEYYDEDLKFQYQNKSMRVYTASIFGLPYRDFPVAAFTSETAYQQWCVLVSGVMPDKRKQGFHKFMCERLADAEEVEIAPNMEEGVEVGVVVLTILKNASRNIRDFDFKQENDELEPGEWLFAETVEDSKCGCELFIKYEGLKAKILDQVAMGTTETKMTRKEVVDWLLAHGRHFGRDASVNRRRSAYALPYELVEKFEIFNLRSSSYSAR